MSSHFNIIYAGLNEIRLDVLFHFVNTIFSENVTIEV